VNTGTSMYEIHVPMFSPGLDLNTKFFGFGLGTHGLGLVSSSLGLELCGLLNATKAIGHDSISVNSDHTSVKHVRPTSVWISTIGLS